VIELVPGAMVTPTLRLVRALGAGGMGRVWIAYHLGLRTQVVVKFVSEELAQDPDALARFSREAAAASQVKSPHVVQMIDYGVTPHGTPYIAMELLEGKDLFQLLGRYGTLSQEGVAKIVTQVSRALMRANEKGIVHRDIKPENIFLIDAGGGEIFAKVLDFGIAKASIHDTGRATGTGTMLGTPLYMSPEQVLGSKDIDHRSDQWSLGVVAFEALTGAPPFAGDTVGAISVAICHAPIPKPSERNRAIGPAVDAWFLRACAREVSKRFTSAKEMAEALVIAISEDSEDENARTREVKKDEPFSFGTSVALPPAIRPQAVPTMVEVFEETETRRPGAGTTDAVTARTTDGQGPTSADRRRRLLPAYLAGGFLLSAVAIVLVVRLLSGGHDGAPTNVPRKTPASAASSSPPQTPTTTEETTASPIPSVVAPVSSPLTTAAPVMSQSALPPVVMSAPTSTKPTAPPSSTGAPTTTATVPPKPKKGSNVIIE
jgi:serine/threonine protein kinase